MVGFTGFSTQQGDVSRDPTERITARLVFWDDFEDITPKCTGVAATTAEVTHDEGAQGSIMPYEGAKMLRVSDVSHVTNQVYYTFGPNKTESQTVQYRFRKDADTADEVIQFDLYDGTNLETYKLKFLESGMKLQYWNAAGAYVDLTGGALSIADGTWNTITLCINPVDQTYIYCRINDHQINMKGVAALTGASATEGKNVITIGGNSKAADDDAYYDDFRVYSNEVKVS